MILALILCSAALLIALVHYGGLLVQWDGYACRSSTRSFTALTRTRTYVGP